MSGAYQTNAKTAGPWVDIDLGALCANYAMIRDQAPDAQTAAVVKCDAYGLGLDAIARTLAEREKCKSFFVAYPEEGAALRNILDDSTPEIYVFNGPLPQTMALFEASRLTPVLNSLEQAEKWSTRQPGAPAALHIDTGMNRLGAPLNEVSTIAALKGLSIDLVMSHLACASMPAAPKNKQQKDIFVEAAAQFPGARLSLSASGGALMGKEFHFDLIRPGIALYGGSPFDVDEPSPETRRRSAGAGGSTAPGRRRRDSRLQRDAPTRQIRQARNRGARLWRWLSPRWIGPGRSPYRRRTRSSCWAYFHGPHVA